MKLPEEEKEELDELLNLEESYVTSEVFYDAIADLNNKIKETTQTTEKAVTEIKDIVSSIKIPSLEDMEGIAKKYVKAPEIINQIVERETVLEPRIIETTREIIKKEKYDDSKLKKEIVSLSEKISNIKLPEPVDLDNLRNEFQENLQHSIDTLGMPNFRKLAMGLQAQIDGLGSGVSFGTDGQLPYMNVAGDDFDYTSNLKYSSASNQLQLVASSNTHGITISGNANYTVMVNRAGFRAISTSNPSNTTDLQFTTPTDVRTINFKDGSGTVAFTTDIDAGLDTKADRSLNNLITTAINTSLLFDTDATHDIGQAGTAVRALYLSGGGTLDFSNSKATMSYSTETTTLSLTVDNTVAVASESMTFTGSQFTLNSTSVDVNGFLEVTNAITGASGALCQFTNPNSAASDQIRVHFIKGSDTGTGVNKGMVFFVTDSAGNKRCGWADYEGRDLTFWTGSGAGTAERLRINATGQVGIGTLGTIATSTQLQITNATTQTVPEFYINQTSTGDSALQFSITGDAYAIGIDNSDNDAFKISYSGTAGAAVLGTNDRFIIDASGNVGIGTTSTVSAKLHVLLTTEQLRVGYDTSNYYSTTVGSTGGVTFNAVGSGSLFTFSDGVTINGTLTLSAQNIVTDTTTGMKVGTATNQKLGFFNATPVIQPTALTTQLTDITFTAPGTPDYAIQDLTAGGFGFVTADEGQTVLSVIKNLQTRVQELEDKLQSLGLLA